jgi:predicted kinase
MFWSVWWKDDPRGAAVANANENSAFVAARTTAGAEVIAMELVARKRRRLMERLVFMTNQDGSEDAFKEETGGTACRFD